MRSSSNCLPAVCVAIFAILSESAQAIEVSVTGGGIGSPNADANAAASTDATNIATAYGGSIPDPQLPPSDPPLPPPPSHPGGTATAHASTSIQDAPAVAKANAYAGSGGGPDRFFNQGGDSVARATAEAIQSLSAGPTSVLAYAYASGGSAGSGELFVPSFFLEPFVGYAYRPSARGGEANALAEAYATKVLALDPFNLEGPGSSPITLSAAATGGSGGRGGMLPGGTAYEYGTGGDTVARGVAEGGGNIQASVNALGGQGGDAFDDVFAHAGSGGQATVSGDVSGGANLENSVNLALHAMGGRGGASHTYGWGSGYGSLGGKAIVAPSTATAIGPGSVSLSASAYGGAGSHVVETYFGGANLPNAGEDSTAGRGGDVSVGQLFGASNGGTVQVNALAVGGSGGYANHHGHGGDGAPATLANVVSGSTSGFLDLGQSATGGNAGLSNLGQMGLPGFASSTLTASNPGGGSIRGIVHAFAGSYPSDYGLPALDNRPGQQAYSALDLTAAQTVDGTALATGGAGSPENWVGVAGDGSSALIGPVRGNSTTGKSVKLTAGLTGGNGGRSLSGNAGHGGSVELTDVVDGSTTGPLDVSQAVIGGAGGDTYFGGHAGDGGNALSSWSLGKSVGSLSVFLDATGGAGGKIENQTGPGIAGHGGDGDAFLHASNAGPAPDPSSLITYTRAAGGAGGNASGAGNGGSAHNDAYGETLGDGRRVIMNGGATGGAGGRATLTPPSNLGSAGRGGNADSTTTGVALGKSQVSVTDRATGGKGGDYGGLMADGGQGGDALSTASASNGGSEGIGLSAFTEGGAGGAGFGAGHHGGNGGAGSLQSARGVSTDGNVTVNGYQYGGAGGDGYNGADGGAGAASVMVNVVRGDTTGQLSLVQSAIGGKGGGAYSGGRAGPGGLALSALNADRKSSSLSLAAFAQGGDAGAAGAVDASVRGGPALAFATGTNIGLVDVTATATAGTSLVNRLGGSAAATATGDGTSGRAYAESMSRGGRFTNIRATSDAVVDNATSTDSRVLVSDPLPDLSLAESSNGVSWVRVGQSDAEAASLVLGGEYSLEAQGGSHVYRNTVSMNLDPAQLPVTGQSKWRLSFVPMTSASFQSISLSLSGGGIAISQTFFDPSQANAFLSNSAYVLTFTSSTPNLTVALDLTLAAFGQSALAQIALAPLSATASVGDFNGDNVVSGADLTVWNAEFGQSGGPLDADANADGRVDGADFLIWQQNLGVSPSTASANTAIPEPIALALCAPGLALLYARRIRRRELSV